MANNAVRLLLPLAIVLITQKFLLVQAWNVEILGNLYASEKAPAVVTCQASGAFDSAQLLLGDKVVVSVDDGMGNNKYMAAVIPEFRDRITIEGETTNVKFTAKIKHDKETTKDISCAAFRNGVKVSTGKVNMKQRGAPQLVILNERVVVGNNLCLMCKSLGGGKTEFIYPDEKSALVKEDFPTAKMFCWKSTEEMNGKQMECKQSFHEGEAFQGKSEKSLEVVKMDEAQKPKEEKKPEEKKPVEDKKEPGVPPIQVIAGSADGSVFRTEVVSWIILALSILVFAIVLTSACVGVFTFFNTQ